MPAREGQSGENDAINPDYARENPNWREAASVSEPSGQAALVEWMREKIKALAREWESAIANVRMPDTGLFIPGTKTISVDFSGFGEACARMALSTAAPAPATVPCSGCGGHGRYADDDTCTDCGGSGRESSPAPACALCAAGRAELELHVLAFDIDRARKAWQERAEAAEAALQAKDAEIDRLSHFVERADVLLHRLDHPDWQGEK